MKRYLDCFVPIYACNFQCHYCYVSLLDNFKKTNTKFSRPVEEIVAALSRKRLGDDVFINLCAGGETLLVEDSVKLIRGLLEEGHHISVVTNGSLSKRFEEIAKFPPELLKLLFFKFSYHYLELKRMNKLDEYFYNVRKMRDAGCSFTIEITPSDELIPHVEEAKKICLENLGAMPHCTIARDDRTNGIDILSNMSWEEYVKQWSTFESELFTYKSWLYHNKIKSFCYAGAWSYYINLDTGDVSPCNCGRKFANVYEKMDEPLPEQAMGNNCELPYCYNGHSWLSLGVNPDEKSPMYTSFRNRVCLDGSEWVTEEYKKFWSSQIFANHQEYDAEEKKKINRRHKLEKYNLRRLAGKVYRKLRC